LTKTIGFDGREHHFYVSPKARLKANELKFPLSISLQVTRTCNLNCVYCSEVGDIPTPSLNTTKKMISNLIGVERIILTGGEPLMRDDLIEIAKHAKQSQFNIVSIATNAVLIKPEFAKDLASFVDYVDVTIDGPRKIHNKIRGEYDAAMSGIRKLQDAQVAFSIVTVLFRENVDSILHICQIADVLGAKKLKILPPIVKGRGKNVLSKLLSPNELLDTFQKIRLEKERNGWTPRITLTDWEKVGEGHALLVHPNGDVVASPVPSEKDCIEVIGNILEEKIKSIWKRYSYKRNHLNKYIEKTLYVC